MTQFAQKQLIVEFNGQKVGIPCLVLSDPSDNLVWIQLNHAPPVINLPCLQQVNINELV